MMRMETSWTASHRKLRADKALTISPNFKKSTATSLLLIDCTDLVSSNIIRLVLMIAKL